MSTGMFRIAYCSRSTSSAVEGDLDAEVSRILEVARARNAEAGVTGALLYNLGCFAQVLEGSIEAVHETFERIQRDPRHHEVVVLSAERVTQPMFALWSMALAETGNPAHANAILRPALVHPSADAGVAIVTLLSELVCREAAWSV